MANAIVNRGSIYLRILCMIDVLAPMRRGINATDLTERVNELTGRNFSSRTIRRDLQSLAQVGYVRQTRAAKANGTGQISALWVLNLDRSRYAQLAAVVAFESEAA